ncbi:tRNA/tmRNA (uracil-C(5))-methyltransferase [Chloropicon primus]|nr:tRNA/tmRNA (uracil-C(5))-methyltransferase [Chloropicon primus]
MERSRAGGPSKVVRAESREGAGRSGTSGGGFARSRAGGPSKVVRAESREGAGIPLLSSYKPEEYEEVLGAKIRGIEGTFGDLLDRDGCEVTREVSPKAYFRLRCRFGVSCDGDGVDGLSLTHTLYNRGGPRVSVSSYPVASKQINALMPKVADALGRGSPVLRTNLTGIHYLTTLAEKDVVVTLVYDKPLEDAEQWQREAKRLGDSLSVSLIGRSKGVKLVCGKDYVVESMRINDSVLSWKQVEGSFSNPNGEICKRTIEHICGLASQIARDDGGVRRDLLDLYCGNGNYTVPLSPHFSRILSVELNKSLVSAARENMRSNSVANVQLCQSCCMKFSQNVRAKRGGDFQAYSGFDFSTILVDPPRAGLDPNTLHVANAFDHIIYISCNAETLKACLEQLTNTHELRSFKVFDHFPYTEWSECVVHLRRRG